ncbi:MAG: ATP-binding protein [Anaerolineales bacterium]
MDFATQIDYLLIRPPGSLLYHLVLAFSVVGALIGAYNQWRNTEFPQARRMVIGLASLLTIAVAQYLLGLLSFQVRLIPDVVLPPLDRAFMVINLALIIWLWAFPEPAGRGDAATGLLIVLAVLGLIFNVVVRLSSGTGGAFNNSYENLAWEVLTLALAALGGLILVRRKPAGWTFGLTALVIIFIGVLIDTVWPTPADGQYSIFVRVAAMSAYPMLLTLPHRFQGPADRRTPRTKPVVRADAEAGNEQQFIQERRRYSTDPKTLHALLALAAETDAERINQIIARAVSQSMLADLCFIIYLGEDKKQLVISSGYDLIREESLEGGLLNRESIPMLSSAIQRGKPLRLPASTTSSDLKGLGDMLGLPSPGNLLNVPITSEKGPLGGILVLSPYSNRVWSAEDQTFLMSIAENLLPIIERGRKIASIEMARERAERAMQDAFARASEAERERSQALAEVESIREQTKDARQQAETLAQTLQVKQELEARVQQLETELNELRAAETIVASSGSQLEEELRQTLKEMARLQNQLAEANMRILELESSSALKRPSANQTEVIASMAQELRQPMASIVGYTDLLLSESVGILGALQRKFIERIKASTERIDNLINDLIQLTAVDSGNVNLTLEAVDLNLIIDNAMAYTSSQLREKNITLRIDMPQQLGPVHADREAMQQILIHLLQNAGAATPIEGTITLRVRKQQENGQDFILMQVSDTGGGIPEHDLPRVFSRLYRADNALIQGVGDTGVGLSLAKTLTEAQGGRIWVDSEPNVGATFHVLLPVGGLPPSAQSGA